MKQQTDEMTNGQKDKRTKTKWQKDERTKRRKDKGTKGHPNTIDLNKDWSKGKRQKEPNSVVERWSVEEGDNEEEENEVDKKEKRRIEYTAD